MKDFCLENLDSSKFMSMTNQGTSVFLWEKTEDSECDSVQTMWKEVIQDGGICINLKIFKTLFFRAFSAYETHGLGVYQLELRTGIYIIEINFIGSV